MSKSPSEHGNASSIAPVRPEQALDKDGNDRTHARRPIPPPNRRNPSSSLLSRLLSPTPEVDESISDRLDATVPGEQQNGVAQSQDRGVPGNLRTGHKDNVERNSKASSRAKEDLDIGDVVQSPVSYWPQESTSAPTSNIGFGTSYNNVMATATLRANALSLGPSPVSTSPGFDLSDMTHVNNLLNSHRAFLNLHRGRGTSLERTHRERRVQTMPLDTSALNPGDTGITRPSTPLSPDSLTTNTPPVDGVRARYRSWRDTRASTMAPATEKAWSIDDDGSGELPEGQVEKSIAEALAGIEPNNRSRKSSHSLRFFREGLPEEPRKTAKDRGRSNDQSQRMKDLPPPVEEESGDGISKVVEDPGKAGKSEQYRERAPVSGTVSGGSSTTSSVAQKQSNKDHHESYIGSQADTSLQQSHPFPQQLLDDLRKRHNLLPAPKKRSSFSKSLPAAESEQQKQAEEVDERLSTSEKPARRETELLSPTHTHEEDDEESGEERISSALFVPHQSSRSKLHHERTASDLQDSHPSPRDSSTEPDQPEQWLVEHQIPPSKLSMREDAPIPGTPAQSEFGDSEYNFDPPSELESGDELIHDAQQIEIDDAVEVNDDGEITPTGTLKNESHMTKENEDFLHNHQQVAKPPPEHIELVPYTHQVGGHTTMWRFSKKAVCKQLNNRENEFYEVVEHNHPKLLKFMPKYIGVLNVTFEKQIKRKITAKEEAEVASTGAEASAGADGKVKSKDDTSKPESNAEPITPSDPAPRMISQSMGKKESSVTASVTLADNRHIIPKSFLLSQSDSHRRSLSTGANGIRSHSQPPAPGHQNEYLRPTLTDKHANSWGATSVNRQLRYEVFGEAFGQSIPVQKHKKPSQAHRALTHRAGKSKLRNSNSEGSLQTAQENQTTADDSMRKRALMTAASSLTMTPMSGDFYNPREDVAEIPTEDDGSAAAFEEQAGTSAPEPDIGAELRSPKKNRKRRYSSGGLRRKPNEVADDRGNLKYFEEADDAGYGADGEDGMFNMDPEPSTDPGKAFNDAEQGSKLQLAEAARSAADAPQVIADVPHNAIMDPSNPDENDPDRVTLARPVNPNVARIETDKRVEFFLLLEDLTAGMKRPCIMDLKMGTRQYGIDANLKKQESQRRKCAETTSRELGVRVCGLQVWDAGDQKYIFQDKYFGRDLKVGKEFKNALRRFLYNGIQRASIVRHIPVILRKLDKLETQVRTLVGYRFYAASLLLFYDGDNTQAEEVRPIDFKIADFANCVTAEIAGTMERECPPRHPNTPDFGFLKGLTSLRKYFLTIQKEVMLELGFEMGSGPEFEEREIDLGELSY